MANPSQNDEDEYQFSEQEEHSPTEKYSSSAAPSTAQGGKSSTKKRVLILVGLIVGIFCLYKLYGLFMTSSSAKKPAVPTMVQTKPVTPADSQPQSAATPAVMAKPVDEKPAEIESQHAISDNSIKDKVSSLEETITQNIKSQENLQNEIAGLSSAITEIQSNVAMLTQQINSIAQQKNETQKKVSEKAKVRSAKPKKVVRPVSGEKKVAYHNYYVKALIQGRAWLTDLNGATFTVSTGDQLPGYGEIRDIDPSKGIVMTSSGRVINYMSQDR